MLVMVGGGLRMVMLSPAVQMPPSLTANRACLSALPQYVGAAAAAATLQPDVRNITGYRLPQHANTYVNCLLSEFFACCCCSYRAVFHSLPEPNRAWLLVVYVFMPGHLLC